MESFRVGSRESCCSCVHGLLAFGLALSMQFPERNVLKKPPFLGTAVSEKCRRHQKRGYTALMPSSKNIMSIGLGRRLIVYWLAAFLPSLATFSTGYLSRITFPFFIASEIVIFAVVFSAYLPPLRNLATILFVASAVASLDYLSSTITPSLLHYSLFTASLLGIIFQHVRAKFYRYAITVSLALVAFQNVFLNLASSGGDSGPTTVAMLSWCAGVPMLFLRHSATGLWAAQVGLFGLARLMISVEYYEGSFETWSNSAQLSWYVVCLSAGSLCLAGILLCLGSEK